MRFCNASDVQHRLATDAISRLLAQEDECLLTAQVLIEFWVVATRPIEVNGLGWTVDQTRNTIDQLFDRFPLIEETSQIFPIWLNLVTNSKVIGKRTHDVRIIVTMLAHGITHLLTFNPGDFAITSSLTVIQPQGLVRLESSLRRQIMPMFKTTETAVQHLSAIYAYIAQNSPKYAERIIDRLTRRSQQITPTDDRSE